MGKSDRHIDYDLLAKYLAGECSSAEEQEVQMLIQVDKEARKIIEQGTQLFKAQLPDEESITPDFQVEKAWKTVRNKLHSPSGEINKTIQLQRFKPFAWKVAAILIVGLGITWFFYSNRSVEVNYWVAQHEIREFYLPDSTLLVLRDSSSLTTSAGYNSTERSVTLHGIAYFDVVRNADKPFTVTVNGAKIRVLGTAFQIDTKNPEEVNVMVERGSVEFSSTENPEKATLIMEKNESATLLLDEVKISKKEVLNLNNLYWANKKLIYRQQPLPLVLNELEELFDVNIEYNPEAIEECKLTAIFKDEPFENILQLISVSMDFEYQLTDGIYTINSDGCEIN